MNRLYTILYYIIYPIYSIFHHCKGVGLSNIPEGDGVLFCANHTALCDPLCILLALGPKRQTHVMGKSEFINAPIIGGLMKKLGMFAVDRGKSDVAAIKTALRYLKGGEKVLIFPEGTRIKNGVDKYGNKPEAHAGAAMLAVRTGVPIVPVYLPEKKKWFGTTDVIFGEPYYPQTADRRATAEEYRIIADEVMDRVHKLGEERK